MALAKAKEPNEDFYDGWDGTKAYRYTNLQEMTASSEVTFTTVTGITYTPATYETVEAEWKPTLCNEKPVYDPSVVHQVGDKDGCWTWKEIKAFDMRYFDNNCKAGLIPGMVVIPGLGGICLPIFLL